MTGVIILNYYSHEDTLRLFTRLSEFKELDLLVVDNSCDVDEATALGRMIPVDRLITTQKNMGYAGGNNLGIRKLLENEDIKCIALLNPDIRVHSNIFEKLGAVLRDDPEVAAVAPRLCDHDDEQRIYSDGGRLARNGYLKPDHLHRGLRIRDVSDTDHSNRSEKLNQNVDYVNGSCIMLNVKAIRDVGYFNEKFFLYFEEADWCVRAKERGWKLVVNSDVSAWQKISEKGVLYNYYYFRGWFLFLHLYDKEGIRILAADQLKKVKWILQSKDIPVRTRLEIAWSRFRGIVMGFFNL